MPVIDKKYIFAFNLGVKIKLTYNSKELKTNITIFVKIIVLRSKPLSYNKHRHLSISLQLRRKY
jgi:hypothetical protein